MPPTQDSADYSAALEGPWHPQNGSWPGRFGALVCWNSALPGRRQPRWHIQPSSQVSLCDLACCPVWVLCPHLTKQGAKSPGEDPPRAALGERVLW